MAAAACGYLQLMADEPAIGLLLKSKVITSAELFAAVDAYPAGIMEEHNR